MNTLAEYQRPTAARQLSSQVNVERQTNGTMSFSGGSVGGMPRYSGAEAAGFKPGHPGAVGSPPMPVVEQADAKTRLIGNIGRSPERSSIAAATANPVSALNLGLDTSPRYFEPTTARPLPTAGAAATAQRLAAMQGVAGDWVGPRGINEAQTKNPAADQNQTLIAQGTDARHLTGDFDRTQVARPRDVSRILSTLPENLPGDLRDGVIHKTMDANGRPVYSGRNVDADAQFVDGRGAAIDARGTLSTVDAGGTGSGAYLDRQVSAARQAAMARGDLDAVRSSFGEGPAGPRAGVVGATGGFGFRRDPSINARDRRDARQVMTAFGQDPASMARADQRRDAQADRAIKIADLNLRRQEQGDKSRASADETARFSATRFRMVLGNIGERKLSAFFEPEEIAQLKAIGRVATYTQHQPAGSAVNNSNSGALLLGRGIAALDAIASKVPLLGIGPQITNITRGVQQRQAQNVAGALVNRPIPITVSQRTAPAVTFGSLSLLPGVDEREEDSRP